MTQSLIEAHLPLYKSSLVIPWPTLQVQLSTFALVLLIMPLYISPQQSCMPCFGSSSIISTIHSMQKRKRAPIFGSSRELGRSKGVPLFLQLPEREKNEHMQELIGCSGIRSLASLGQCHWDSSERKDKRCCIITYSRVGHADACMQHCSSVVVVLI